MTNTQELRKTFIQQSDQLGAKQRFGLFSQPISNAIGDDGEYQRTLYPKGEDNKPLTHPRNVITAASRSGQGNSGFFGPLNPLMNGTKPVVENQEKPQKASDGKHPVYGHIHQKDFLPAPTNKTLYKPAYPYKQQNPPPKNPKRNRASQGNVIIHPRNMICNTTSTIERSLFKQVKHMDDPYDNAKKLEREQLKKQRGYHHQHPFQTTAYGPRVLNGEKQIYGTDVNIVDKPKRPQSHNYIKHQNTFKYSNPTKWGIYGYFTSFPKHQPNPPKERKASQKDPKEKKECFRTMSVPKSRPSSSITTNPMNMRRYCTNSFSHRF